MSNNQSRIQQDSQENHLFTFEFLASLVTVISVLLVVIYSNENYDIWDGTIAISLIIISKRYLKSEKTLLARWVVTSVATAIILFTLITSAWSLIYILSPIRLPDESGLVLNRRWNIVPLDFIISIAIGLVIFVTRKKYRSHLMRSIVSGRTIKQEGHNPRSRGSFKRLRLWLDIIAKPFSIFISFSPEVKAAIIGGLFLLLFAFLEQSGVIADLARIVRTRTITVYPNENESGGVHASSNFVSLKSNPNMWIGDTEDNNRMEAFFTFYTGQIPEGAEIVSAELSFPCKIIGNISGFGDVSLEQAIYEYDGKSFDENDNRFLIPSDTLLVFEDNIVPLKNCDGENQIVFGKVSKIIDSNRFSQSPLTSRYEVQLKLYFDGQSITANDSKDGISLTDKPFMRISYVDY